MTIPSNDLPDMQIDTSLTSPKGSAAAQRALDYYLKPAVSEEVVEERFFDVNRNISSEEALVHASDLLRCAAAIAYESASNLQGAQSGPGVFGGAHDRHGQGDGRPIPGGRSERLRREGA